MSYNYNEFGQFVYKEGPITTEARCVCRGCGRKYEIRSDRWWCNHFYCSEQCCAVRREQLAVNRQD